MPFKVSKGRGCPEARPWAVLKDGKKVSCSVSKSKARESARARSANEDKKGY